MDLGVVINSNLKWDDQVNQAMLKATSILGKLKRTICRLERPVTSQTTYVRPHLEYCSSSCNPYNEPRRANLVLTTLEISRKKGELIQFFKIL